MAAAERMFLSDLDFIVFRRREHVGSFPGSRFALPLDGLFFSGIPMLAPVAILDVFFGCPSEMKLFGVNFMISRNAYYEGYASRSTSKYPKGFFCVGHSRHDLLEQVNVVRNLWRAGFVEVDLAAQDILEMPEEVFYGRADDLYGEPWK
jgi:hypothetical protein